MNGNFTASWVWEAVSFSTIAEQQEENTTPTGPLEKDIPTGPLQGDATQGDLTIGDSTCYALA